MHAEKDPATLDARYRTILILWFALFVAIGLYFVVSLLNPATEQRTENKVLSYSLAVLGMFAVIASYFVKQRFLTQSVKEQNTFLVQQGTVIAAALCEASALLGLFDYFVTGNRYYYLLMIIAALGSLLNFPRRDQLLAASYKSSQPKDPWK